MQTKVNQTNYLRAIYNNKSLSRQFNKINIAKVIRNIRYS